MGYQDPPWIFKGRALYQLQLVPVAEARKYIPEGFKIVNFFGWTLGGFYLARYSDSPVGAFDELVAMAGLVWNPPTSCAWAARVFVNNREARNHGLTSVGLPSRFAQFAELPVPLADATSSSSLSSSSSSKHSKRAAHTNWWHQGVEQRDGKGGQVLELRNSEKGAKGLKGFVCRMQLPEVDSSVPRGPRINLSLPSFSGGTEDCRGLLKYACALTTNVSFLPAAKVTVDDSQGESTGSVGGESLRSLLGGRPLVTMSFDDMLMRVEKPEPVVLRTRATARSTARTTPTLAPTS